jgi:CxxC motif-containing protein
MMEEIIKIFCVSCPKGCILEVTRDGDTITNIVSGCKRGDEYALQELTDPRRMVATTVRVKNGFHPLVPVYTKEIFPKGKIFDLLKLIREMEVQAPVQKGDVILEDALGTGIDVIASRDMDSI